MSCGCVSSQSTTCDLNVIITPCDQTEIAQNNHILSKLKDCVCNSVEQKRLKPIEWQPSTTGETCIELSGLLPSSFDKTTISCVDIYWNGQRMAQNISHPDWINFNFNAATCKITSSEELAVDCIVVVDVWYEQKKTC